MHSHILESFEHQGKTIRIHLEEDPLDRDWLIGWAYYADGALVNTFVYSVRKKKEFARSVRFDIESEMQKKCDMAFLREGKSAHEPKYSYKPAVCQIKIARRDDS